MTIWETMRRFEHHVSYPVFLLQNISKENFTCPICGYYGPFKDINPATGHRKHALCPKCNAAERHRLQHLVMKKVLGNIDCSSRKMLHVAPEPFFRKIFGRLFGRYETADLNMPDVDHQVDLQGLPFEDQSYDIVFASHVLEHIPDDRKAISEIRRILKPNGIAVLPVPIVGEKTIDYFQPSPSESNHMRAPGLDYFDRYSSFFSNVVKISSDSLPDRFQLFLYEDRSRWPTKECPFRLPIPGEKHTDIVPVCYV